MTTKHMILLLVAVLVGGVVPIQATVNSRLGSMLGSAPAQKLTATVVSFTGGTIAAYLLLAVVAGGLPKLETPLRSIPPLFFTGGLYGVLFVSASIMLVPRIGVAATVGAMLCGQMLMSVLFDQIGFLGSPKYAASPTRLAGLALMMVGLVLVSQKAPAASTPDPTPPDPTPREADLVDES